MHCRDRKARAACAQSFALWQQATIEITHRNRSIVACSRHIYMGVLRAHSVRGEPRIQRNASGEVATTSAPFFNEPHRSHVLCVKVTPTSWSHCKRVKRAPTHMLGSAGKIFCCQQTLIIFSSLKPLTFSNARASNDNTQVL